MPRTWSSKVGLLSNFTPRMSTSGLARIETPDKTKSPFGGLKVLDLLTTNGLVLLGFSIMHHWLHHPWILATSLLREAATAGLSAGLRTTASSVESSACIGKLSVLNQLKPLKLLGSMHSLAYPSTTTHCLRSESNSVQTDTTLPPTPIDFNLNKRPLWLNLSKAALKSSWPI